MAEEIIPDLNPIPPSGVMITCSLCGAKIDEAHSDNAAPYPGRCCHECNEKHVLPPREDKAQEPDRNPFLN